MNRLREGFAALVAGGDERTDLARAALEIARIEYPALDPSPSLAALDVLAAGAGRRLRPGMPGEEAAAALAAHLFEECGFHGNQADYYDPRNSFLNDVLERRTGIPISLAVLFLETGARLGVPLEGVGFPGHFLVRVAGTSGPILLDPFFGGRVVGAEELLTRLRTLQGDTGSEVTTVPAAALETTGTLGILARMLRNLLHIYLHRDDPRHALDAADLLSVLAPGSPDLLRIRGLLYDRLECFAAALDDLQGYLARVPDAPDADDVRARIGRLARAVATVH